jgi:hypothetical protein
MGDPPKKPWQGGEFIKREGDQLVWASVVEDVHGALVQAKFRITLQAEVFEKTSLVVTRN